MKNMKKLAAGFIAAAMAMSMGVSAFAEVVVPTISEDKATLSVNVTSNEDQITMMAYVVEGTDWTVETVPAYSNQTIVALDQEAGSKGFTTVPVDPAKLEDGNTIVVKIGGSAGDVATYLIAMEEQQQQKYSVTFMNGATATPVVSENGKVTLPTSVEWNGGAPVADCAFELYSWVTADGTEYVIGDNTEIDFGAELTADMTLYAKYNTGIIVGDVDGYDGVDSTDSAYIDFWSFDGDNYVEDRLGLPIYAGSEILIGDVDGYDGVDSTDSAYIDFWSFDGDNYVEDRLGLTIYLINGETVEAVFAE